MTELLLVLGAITGVGALIIYDAFAWGYVLYKLYYWFALPVFPNLPHISFFQAVGLFFIILLFKIGIKQSKYEMPNGGIIEAKHEWTPMLVLPWIFLLICMFVRLFI